MAFFRLSEKIDVLVIGLGSAGCRAAIEAARGGANVLLLGKGPLGKSGITPLIFSGYTAVTGQEEGDSPEDHFRDTVLTGKYLSDQSLAEVMTAEGGQSVRDLVSFGVRFKMDGQKYYLWPRLPGMSHRRMLDIVGAGPGFMNGLRREILRHRAIRLVEDFAITHLASEGAICSGAIGVDLKTGAIGSFAAKAVVLATGGYEQIWLHTDCPPDSTGDGYSLALKAGAKLVDMEQQLFYPTVIVMPEVLRGLEITCEAYNRRGVKLINGKGEAFLLGGDFPTREAMANLIFGEIAAGRGTEAGGIRLDITGCASEVRDEIASMMPANKRLLEFGVDVRREPLEVAPAAHTTLGGVKIDSWGQTTIEGLFACGEVAGNVHGASRLAGNALLDTQVFGARAGATAAKRVAAYDYPKLPGHILEEEGAKIRAFMAKKKDPVRPHELKDKIRQIVWSKIGLRREGKRLKEAIEALEALRRDDLARLSVVDIEEYNFELLDALEAVAMVDVAEMVARAALKREESRGAHFREDYPELDKSSLPKHTVLTMGEGGISLGSETVNITKLAP